MLDMQMHLLKLDDFAILVHGVDFYKELKPVKDIKDHDYRGAGGTYKR